MRRAGARTGPSVVALLRCPHALNEHRLRQSVRIAIEVVVLSLTQRAQIGQLLEITHVNSRAIVSRARKRLVAAWLEDES